MSDPLAVRLSEALEAAQHRYRTRRGFGALVTPVIPPKVIDGFAEALAPILRQAVRDAMTERLDGPGQPEKHLAATDLRRGKEAG